MNIKPVGRKLIVDPLEVTELTLPSGIVLPESAMAKMRKSKVIAVSDEIKHLFPEGSIVLSLENKGIGQPYEGRFYLWLDATIEKDEIWGLEVIENQPKDKGDSL